MILLQLTAQAWAVNAGIWKKNFRSGAHDSNIFGSCVTMIVTNKEIEVSLAGFGVLIKGISITIDNEAKEQKGVFLGMLFVL